MCVQLPNEISAEQAAKVLDVPELAIPQMVIDGILVDIGGLRFYLTQVKSVAASQAARYR